MTDHIFQIFDYQILWQVLVSVQVVRTNVRFRLRIVFLEASLIMVSCLPEYLKSTVYLWCQLTSQCVAKLDFHREKCKKILCDFVSQLTLMERFIFLITHTKFPMPKFSLLRQKNSSFLDKIGGGFFKLHAKLESQQIREIFPFLWFHVVNLHVTDTFLILPRLSAEVVKFGMITRRH